MYVDGFLRILWIVIIYQNVSGDRVKVSVAMEALASLTTKTTSCGSTCFRMPNRMSSSFVASSPVSSRAYIPRQPIIIICPGDVYTGRMQLLMGRQLMRDHLAYLLRTRQTPELSVGPEHNWLVNNCPLHIHRYQPTKFLISQPWIYCNVIYRWLKARQSYTDMFQATIC